MDRYALKIQIMSFSKIIITNGKLKQRNVRTGNQKIRYSPQYDY